MNENYARDLQKSLQTDTGAPLFSPQILNYEQSAGQEGDVFSKLYDQGKHKDMRSKDNYNKYLEEIHKLAEVKLTNDKTDELNQKMKRDSYRKIFEKLDQEGTGVLRYDIKVETVIKANFNDTVCRYLTPIVEGMRSQNETLNLEEFSATLDHLFSSLSIDEKRNFINNLRERKKPVELNTFTFTPQINEKTKKVLTHSKKYSKDVFERNDEFVKNKRQYLSSKKEERLKEELNSKLIINALGCTFKPKINTKGIPVKKVVREDNI
jgi:hypothetical protein